MRDPNRIDDFCDRLKAAWKRVPDLRFGQLMLNALGKMQAEGRDPFFPEEDEMIRFLEGHVDSLWNKPKTKFHTDDKVRVVKNSERVPEAACIGEQGVVVTTCGRDYLVEFRDGSVHAIFEEDLEAITEEASPHG